MCCHFEKTPQRAKKLIMSSVDSPSELNFSDGEVNAARPSWAGEELQAPALLFVLAAMVSLPTSSRSPPSSRTSALHRRPFEEPKREGRLLKKFIKHVSIC